MRKLLADTGPLYALTDPQDQHHQRALEEQEQLESTGTSPIVIFPVLVECHTLVMRRLGLGFASTWLKEAEEVADLLNPVRKDYLAAADRLRSLPDQEITLVDATLAELSEALDLQIWTFDHHFDVMRSWVWRH